MAHDSSTKWSQQRAKDYQAHPIDPQKVGLTSDEIGTRAVADLVSRDVPRDEIPASMLHSSTAASAAAAAGSAKHAAKHPAKHPGAAFGVGIDLDDRGVAASTLPTASNAPAARAAAPGTAHHKKGGIPVISNLTASDPARGLTAADLARGDNVDTASRYSGVRTAAAGTALAAAAAAPLAMGSRNQCDCTGDLLPDHWQTHHSQGFPASRSCDCSGDLLPDHWQTHHSQGFPASRSCDCTGDLLPDHWQTHHSQAIATPIGGPGIVAPAAAYGTSSYGYAGDIDSSRGQGPSYLGGNISPRARTDLTARDQIPDDSTHKKSLGEKIGDALGLHHSSASSTSSTATSSSSSTSEAPAEKKTLGQKIGAALGFGKKKRKKKSKAGTAAPAATTAAALPAATRKFGSDLTHDSNVVSGADMSAGQGLHREASLEPAPRRSVASEVGLNDPRATQAAIDALPSGINDIKIEGIGKEAKAHKRHESVAVAPVAVAPAPVVVQETIVETQPAIVPERMDAVVGPPTEVYVESIERGPARTLYHQPQAPLAERVVEFPFGSSQMQGGDDQRFMQGGGQMPPSYSSSTFSSDSFPGSGSSTQLGLPSGQQFAPGSSDQQFATGAPTGGSSFQQNQSRNQQQQNF